MRLKILVMATFLMASMLCVLYCGQGYAEEGSIMSEESFSSGTFWAKRGGYNIGPEVVEHSGLNVGDTI